MNIKINEDYFLKSDPMNVIIEERVKKKNKEGEDTGERYNRYRYYTNLENACHGLLDRIIKKEDVKTVESLIQAIHDAGQMISEAVKNRGE